ncbi:HEAT repeat domain-containing protein [Planococcus sp. YIM B11945]|uniref:HEAT repeat domain-containing protein n=1 Tax=Planococcus sp. YIM B11945 TaxID=3435410 RepID=UPI003D7CF5E5
MNTEQKINEIRELQTKDGPESAVEIAVFLEDEDYMVKLIAIQTLGEFPLSDEIKSILLPWTEHLEEEIRHQTLEALWGYTGDDVFRAVVSRLKDSEELVRMSAVETLGEMRDPRAEEFLIKALKDEDELVRRFAAEGLGKLGTDTVIPVLLTYLQKETSSTAKVGFYIELYLLGYKIYLKSLLNLLKDPAITLGVLSPITLSI